MNPLLLVVVLVLLLGFSGSFEDENDNEEEDEAAFGCKLAPMGAMQTIAGLSGVYCPG